MALGPKMSDRPTVSAHPDAEERLPGCRKGMSPDVICIHDRGDGGRWWGGLKNHAVFLLHNVDQRPIHRQHVEIVYRAKKSKEPTSCEVPAPDDNTRASLSLKSSAGLEKTCSRQPSISGGQPTVARCDPHQVTSHAGVKQGCRGIIGFTKINSQLFPTGTN